MYIDFHIHAFADEIAERAISKLEITSDLKAYTNGKISNAVEKLEKWNIDRGVLLPIATKPSQQTTINDWAADIQKNHSRIIAFGSIHPEAPDAFDELERIKSLGLRGIKLHPDYQNFFIDDEKIYPIYEKCGELGLPVIFHAGFDPLSPEIVHALPKASARAHEAVPQMTMILAHLGGMYHWDEVEEYLVGEDIYFDTAFIGGNIKDEQAERIIKKHGADKILLASDCPWHETTCEIALINRLNITDDEKQMIFHKNAEKLLGI